ncbi:PQQ-binding-like beta-propeller repeat protein [Halorubellus sp. JP-L1]|uniref:outer membrane protein assembly factor BamB family protein n=1 Tax=Halorubellus sp. JP-L1 TaxID=2715753 RepID=UPI00140E50D6|nr:PQQ-binding-like beta-propeller repeat protein [Halorubellus sp. JP-L1]NHN40596.1 PQQ-binding-like beta-propeller repeat protein [Halorubellus sp. JP-L1]
MRRRRMLALLGIGGTSGCLRLAGEDTSTRRTATRTTADSTRTQSTTTTRGGTAQSETAEETETTAEPDAPLLADADALERRWTGPEYVSGMALHDDGVFVENEEVVALDRAQGFERWQPYPDRVRDFTVEGDGLFVGTRDGSVVGIDLASREERWRYDGTDLDSAIRAGSSSVVFGEERGGGAAVVCLDAADGTERWRVETENPVSELSPPGDGAVVFGTTGGPSIQCHDLQTGTRRWLSEESHTAMTPLVRNGTAYVPVYRRVIAFDAATGDIEWEYPLPDGAERFEGRSPGQPPVRRDGVLYVPAQEGGLAAIDSQTGQGVWFYEVPESRGGLVTVADGAVWFGTENAVHRVGAATGDGEIIGRFTAETNGLFGLEVDSGTLFVAPSPTAVRAFDVVD